jgi:hypothetical protein
MQLWAVGMVRNEADVVRINVLHHLAQGIDRILLLDNDSSDGTPDVLADLAREHPVEWRSSPGAYRQDRLVTELAHIARAKGADWVIPIDADEFWWAPSGTVRDVLARTDIGSLEASVVNFVQRRDQELTTPDALLHMTRRVATPIGVADENAALVESGSATYVEICYHPKWISRASPDLRIGWGNHTVANAGASRKTSDLVCLHAPLRSREFFHRKLDLSRPPAEMEECLAGAWHLRRWRRLAAEGRLDAEWRANSYAGDALDLNGVARPLVTDFRLRDAVAPWLPGGVTLEARARILDVMRPIEGWFDDGEAGLLIRTAERAIRDLPTPRPLVEIGSYCGRSTVVLGGVVRTLGSAATVYAIDPHEGEVGAVDSRIGLERRPPTFPGFVANVRAAGLDGVIAPIRERSTNVAWRWPISLLLVDGLHDAASVRADVAHFAPWVVPGGYLALHDHCDDFPGVQACARGLLADGTWEAREQAGLLLVLQKVR